MEFTVTSKCRKCGQVFNTYKRYNDFSGKWELDSDSCEECSLGQAIRINDIAPMGDIN